MSFRHSIQKWLGIDDLRSTQEDIRNDLVLLRNELVVTFTDEVNPRRKAVSDELGKRMIHKLEAEDKARRQAGGEL